jgi:hypothetical protein
MILYKLSLVFDFRDNTFHLNITEYNATKHGLRMEKYSMKALTATTQTGSPEQRVLLGSGGA